MADQKESGGALAALRDMKPHPHTLQQLSMLPYFGSFFGFGTILIVYIIAVVNRDIEPLMAYISDASGDPPLSGLFGLCMVIVVIVAIPVHLLVYMRNKIEMKTGKHNTKIVMLEMLNVAVSVFGLASCIGIVLVGVNPLSHLRRDGQWVKPILIPHLIGSVLFFLPGLFHVLTQTYLQYKLSAGLSHIKVKLFLSGVAAVSAFLLTSFAPMPAGPWTNMDPRYKDGRSDLSDPTRNLQRMYGNSGKNGELTDDANQTWVSRSARTYPENAFWSIAAEWIFIFNYLAFYASYGDDLTDFTFALDLYLPDPDASAQLRKDSKTNLAAAENGDLQERRDRERPCAGVRQDGKSKKTAQEQLTVDAEELPVEDAAEEREDHYEGPAAVVIEDQHSQELPILSRSPEQAKVQQDTEDFASATDRPAVELSPLDKPSTTRSTALHEPGPSEKFGMMMPVVHEEEAAITFAEEKRTVSSSQQSSQQQATVLDTGHQESKDEGLLEKPEKRSKRSRRHVSQDHVQGQQEEERKKPSLKTKKHSKKGGVRRRQLASGAPPQDFEPYESHLQVLGREQGEDLKPAVAMTKTPTENLVATSEQKADDS